LNIGSIHNLNDDIICIALNDSLCENLNKLLVTFYGKKALMRYAKAILYNFLQVHDIFLTIK